MSRRQKLDAAEYDWVSKRSRGIIKWGRGLSKWLKKQMNRRIRHEKIEED